MPPIYDQDSFFTLSPAGQVGLIAVTLVISLATLLTLRAVVRRVPRWAAPMLALAAFVLFVWLSPQLYYQYYRLVFDGLPPQWVVRPAPDLPHALRLLTFTDRASLSFHGQGVLGWLMVLVALGGRRRANSP